MKMRIAGIALALIGTMTALPATAEPLSKSFQFKPDVTLEIAATSDDQLRLDSVQFSLPPKSGRRILRTGGHVKAEVAISNLGESGQRVGVAIALFDASGNLVGVASGGTGLMPLKRDRQRSFTLLFDDVNARVDTATTFQITVEARD